MFLSRLRVTFLFAATFLLPACASTPAFSGVSATGPKAYRVYDVEGRRFVAINDLAGAALSADALLFGEYHDSEGAHEAQRDLIQIVAAADRQAVLGFEMFERDVQPIVDHFLDGTIDEAAFLATSRPWPNYTTDYKPLVDVALARKWKVLATNLPQPLATRIGREGLRALDSATPEERRMAPGIIECPVDEYWTSFVEALTGEDSEPGAHSITAALQNLFQAQCARDAAMAEVLLPHVGGEALVIHVNGAFHTDEYLGLTRRILQAKPEAEVVLVSTVGVKSIANPVLDEHLGLADFLIVVQEDPEAD